jgi:hypothetical protein
MDLLEIIDIEKQKKRQIGFRISDALYNYVVKGDENNKSNELRRCLHVSFILKDLFDKLAKENEEIFIKLFDTLDRYSKWELSKFVERYQEQE